MVISRLWVSSFGWFAEQARMEKPECRNPKPESNPNDECPNAEKRHPRILPIGGIRHLGLIRASHFRHSGFAAAGYGTFWPSVAMADRLLFTMPGSLTYLKDANPEQLRRGVSL